MPVCDALRGIVVLVIASLVYCSVKDTTRFIAKTAHNCLLSVSIAAYFFAMYASRALFVITVMRIVSLQRNADNAMDLSATAAFMTLATLVNFPCAKNAKDSMTSHSLSFRYGVLAVEASVATLAFYTSCRESRVHPSLAIPSFYQGVCASCVDAAVEPAAKRTRTS